MPRATLIQSSKQVRADGSFIEILVWLVPSPVPPCTHSFKYALVLIKARVRVVGMDNERGKGDHQHLYGVETPYLFRGVAALLAHFRALVDQVDKRGDE